MVIKKRSVCVLLVLVLAASCFLSACGTQEEDFTTYESLNGARAGCVTGTVSDVVIAAEFPKSNISYVNSYPDAVTALLGNKIDYFLYEDIAIDALTEANPGLTYINRAVYTENIAAAFNKDSERGKMLLTQFNEFLASVRKDGTLDKMLEDWNADYQNRSVDTSGLTGENGVLKVATGCSVPPFANRNGEVYSGFEIDLVTRFCRAYGYIPEYTLVNFSGLIPAITSGKADVATDCIVNTEERAGSVNFSVPYYYCNVYPVVRESSAASTGGKVFKSLASLNGSRAGSLAGTIDEQIIPAKLSDVSIDYYNAYPDMASALLSGKIDFFLYEDMVMDALLESTPGLSYIGESVYTEEVAVGFSKDSERGALLCGQFNEFLASLSADGTLETMAEEWKNSYKTLTVDTSGLTGENGMLQAAVACSAPAFSARKGDDYTGFEIDLITRFCRSYGYIPEYTLSNFASLIPAVVSGKADMAVDCLAVTEERKESIRFSDPYYYLQLYPVVREENAAEGSSFFAGLSRSFTRTFITESRWKMIVKGLGTTIAISLLSAVIGTALGFAFYSLARNRKLLIKILDFLSQLISGLPIVVLLMIMFYVIFGRTSISGFWVSVIAFSLSLALSVYSSLATAVKSIDNGQLEGAYSLGLTDTMAFTRIILPQSMEQFLPNYKTALVSLVQGTSIVGYIAVEDLTRISDLIRAATYEAFFPIISTALIYLLLSWLLTLLVKRVNVSLDPRTRSAEKILRRFAE